MSCSHVLPKLKDLVLLRAPEAKFLERGPLGNENSERNLKKSKDIQRILKKSEDIYGNEKKTI